MTATYNLATQIGRVRLLIPDRDVTDPIFTDEEIEVFVNSEVSERWAAAAALEIAAMDDVLTFKVMKAGSDSVDASKGAEILLDRAAKLRAMEPITESLYAGQIGVIEQAHGVFGWRQVYKNAIRRSG